MILACRRDKEWLKELLDKNATYQKMDEETARTLGVLMGIKRLEENKKKYETEKGEYNVCQAIREMMEDSRLEGSASQVIEIIENIMKELQCSLEKACKIAGKTVSEYWQSEQICGKRYCKR